MGQRNFLVEGVSGTGKTAVCRELRRRGFHAVNGDRELAYWGDPRTGAPTSTGGHEHHLWDVTKVRALTLRLHQALNRHRYVGRVRRTVGGGLAWHAERVLGREAGSLTETIEPMVVGEGEKQALAHRLVGGARPQRAGRQDVFERAQRDSDQDGPD